MEDDGTSKKYGTAGTSSIDIYITEERVGSRIDVLREIMSFRPARKTPGILMLKGSPTLLLTSPVGNADSDTGRLMNSYAFFFSAINGRYIRCGRCLLELQSYWSLEGRSYPTIRDAIGDSDMLRQARMRFSSAHNRWRKKFMKEAEGKCRICGDGEKLELAHITGVEDFFYRYGRERSLRFPGARNLGVEHSYREDNLVVLCRRCHDAQTLGWSIQSALEDPSGFGDLMHRRHHVMDLFEAVIEKRGWRTADDLFQARLF